MITIERVSCFPNEGDPEVIPGEPQDGDLVRAASDDGATVVYQRYSRPQIQPESADPVPAPQPTKADLLAKMEELLSAIKSLG